MDGERFHRFMENPALLDKASLAELEQLVDAYPCSENIRILYTLNLLKEKHFKYQENLVKSAFYSSDRRKLKYWVDFVLSERETEADKSIGLENDGISKEEEPVHDVIDEKTPAPEEDAMETNGIEPLVLSSTANNEKEIEPELGQVKVNEPKEVERDKERKKKNVKTKSELLAMVKKRLAEIEAAKIKEQSQNVDDTDDDIAGKDKKMELIDRFIKQSPSISRPDKADFFDPQQEAVNSTFDDDDFLVTETLARIHTDQGNIEKALEIYEKLILKFPEKSSYFAALIQNLKNTKKE